jgi:hypothetical protein
MKRIVLLLFGGLLCFSTIAVAKESCNDTIIQGKRQSLGEIARFKDIDPVLLAKINNVKLDSKSPDSVFFNKGDLVILPTVFQSLSNSLNDNKAIFSPNRTCSTKSRSSAKPINSRIGTKKESFVSEDGDFWVNFMGEGKGMPYDRDKYVSYTFRADEGDKLDKPAKIYKVSLRLLRFFNGLSSVALSLNGGEEILIPDKDFTYWLNFNYNPFGNRDYDRLFKKFAWGKNFRLMAEVQRKIMNGEFENSVISSGQYLFQMAEGNYQVINNVICAWRQRESVGAKLYKIPLDNFCQGGAGKFLVLADPDVCHNWCWWLEEKREIKAPIPIPRSAPEPIDTPPTPIPPLPEIPTQTTKVVYGGWLAMPRWDTYLSHDWPDDRNFWNRRGATCIGLKFDDFFRKKSWVTRNSFGITAMVNGYDGESTSYFGYDGFNIFGGLAAIWSPFTIVYLSGDGGIGHQWDFGGIDGIDYRYRSFQTSLFWQVGSTLDIVPPWWNLSFWGDYHKSIRRYTYKDAYNNGELLPPSENPAIPITGWNYGIRSYFWVEQPVHPFIVWRESFTKSDKALRMVLGLGFRCLDRRLAFEFSYKHCENSTWNDVNANAYEAVATYGWGYGRGRPKLPQSVAQPVIIQQPVMVPQEEGDNVW